MTSSPKLPSSLIDQQLRQKMEQWNISPVTYLRLLVAMIQADGILHPSEADYFLKMSEILNLSDSDNQLIQTDFMEPPDFESLLHSLEYPESPEARKILLENIFPVALSDGTIDSSELLMFHKLQDHLGVKIPMLER
ncbi:MAG: TerB family tellurite resistance protein [SAR324 cluster bacterium]|nr:TerB family tellurite resistance protein [SAR324 cluster bacterium]